MFSDKNIQREKKFSISHRILQKIKKNTTKNKRNELNLEIKKKLDNISFTLFTNNCLGGVFYHDAGRQFTTPTINLSFDAECFIKFLQNPKHYKNYPMKFITYNNYNFPIAIIDDIEVHFVHYKTEKECIEKWKTRFDRIVWNNIFVVATNHDGFNKPENLEKFDKLPYKNKIMFVSKEYPEYDWAIPVKEFLGRFQVCTMTQFANFKGERYYETNFDIANWIKENSNNKYKE